MRTSERSTSLCFGTVNRTVFSFSLILIFSLKRVPFSLILSLNFTSSCNEFMNKKETEVYIKIKLVYKSKLHLCLLVSWQTLEPRTQWKPRNSSSIGAIEHVNFIFDCCQIVFPPLKNNEYQCPLIDFKDLLQFKSV